MTPMKDLKTLLLAALLPGTVLAQDHVLTPDFSEIHTLPDHVFAVTAEQSFDARTAGHWQPLGDGRAEWTFEVRLRGALSSSVHFSRLSLPPSAQLAILPGEEVVTAADLPLDDHYAWPVSGERLRFVLTVDENEAADVVVEGHRFFAGFERGPALPAKDGSVTPTPSATPRPTVSPTPEPTPIPTRPPDPQRAQEGHEVVNYDCVAQDWPELQTFQRSVVALLVDGVGHCSATLVNHADSDNRAWVVTAAHCGDTLEGEAEANGQAVTARWNRITPCGQTLQNPNRGAGVRGSRTVYTDLGVNGDKVEADDLWVIELSGYPAPSAGAYVYGFDASYAVTGKTTPLYSIHHGDNEDQQWARFTWEELVNRGTNDEHDRVHFVYRSLVQEGGLRGGASGGGASNGSSLVAVLSRSGIASTGEIKEYPPEGGATFWRYGLGVSTSLFHAFAEEGSPLPTLFGALKMDGREPPNAVTASPTPTPTATPTVTPTPVVTATPEPTPFPTPFPTPLPTPRPTAAPQDAGGGGGGLGLGVLALGLLAALRRALGGAGRARSA